MSASTLTSLPLSALTLERRTRETEVVVRLGAGETRLDTGLPMLDHLLEAFAFYAGLDLTLEARDLMPLGDGHHLAEDVAMVLGRALGQSLGDRSGRTRYGQRLLPMDEALATCALDIGGRPFALLDLALPTPTLGGLASENVAHLVRTLAMEARFTVHLSVRGENAHHMAEAAFKALGLALREALAPAEGLRSTKGVLG